MHRWSISDALPPPFTEDAMRTDRMTPARAQQAVEQIADRRAHLTGARLSSSQVSRDRGASLAFLLGRRGAPHGLAELSVTDPGKRDLGQVGR
jgi:hypothetical protein